MNDYLCAVLLNETYLQLSKYNDTQCGDTEKIPKALIDSCTIIGAFLLYRFHSFKVQRMTSIKSSLFAMWFTSYKLKRVKQNRPYILTVKGIKPDIKWTLLNRWKRVFWNLLPAISQNLHTELTLYRWTVSQISFLYFLGGKGVELVF